MTRRWTAVATVAPQVLPATFAGSAVGTGHLGVLAAVHASAPDRAGVRL